jgi:hypothetical protein
MRRSIAIPAVVVSLLAIAILAAAQKKAEMSDAQYITKAISAAPSAVAKDAGVVRMDKDGKMKTLRESKNGFTCMIAGGAKFGYLLLWVILAANLIAMVVQTQSAKLGIATGKNLAELCRESFSRRTSIGLWLQAEMVAMATDIAEVVGAALGLNLLFGIPLFPAGLIAGAGAFAILALQQMGFRRLEAAIKKLAAINKRKLVGKTSAEVRKALLR